MGNLIRALLFTAVSFLSFAASANSLGNFIQSTLAELSQPLNGLILEAREQKTVGPEIWDRLQIHTEGTSLRFIYNYSQQSAGELNIIADLYLLRSVVGTQTRGTTFRESLFNAQNGSLGQRANLLIPFQRAIEVSVREEVASGFIHDDIVALQKAKGLAEPDATELLKIGSQLSKNISEKLSQYLQLHEKDFSKKKSAWDRWKKNSKRLDQLDEAQTKLDDLVRNNDRQGARKLIEAYLPWDMMEPFEVAVWKSWLDGMELKATADNSEILFRGVSYDTDIPFRNEKGGIGFMSTVLTKNQGNYNRRLRSLSVRRLKNGGSTMGFSTYTRPFERAPINTLANQFTSHAANPKGSSFLSLTASLHVALMFAGTFQNDKPGGGVLAVRVHKDRVMANAISSFTGEKEVLLPLLVFPEDVVFYKEIPQGWIRNEVELAAEMESQLSEENKVILKNTLRTYELNSVFADKFAASFQRITKVYSPVMLRCEGLFK